jgi:iron(II)-dependent oxidoreductase
MDTVEKTQTKKRRIASDLARTRQRTFVMTDTLTDNDIALQHSPLMSPLVWDMGHIANFEEFWLLRELGDQAVHDADRDNMYNPFDNPRWVRSELPLLDRVEATEYLDEVRHDVDTLLVRSDFVEGPKLSRDGYVFDMVVQHEAQHHETMLQALDLRPDLEAYALSAIRNLPPARSVDDTERILIDGGPFTLGTDDRSGAYDNERPAHTVEVGAFIMDRFPVTNRRYMRFVDAGGYARRDLWSYQGWEWRASVDHDAPQGWERPSRGEWTQMMFGRNRALDPTEPVIHITYWEAEAFAAFVGARLPTEMEWEKAASWSNDAARARVYPWGNAAITRGHANVGQSGWGPAPVGSYPAGASAYGVEQLLGDVYEWTSSEFEPYPGYSTFPYPEYSEVFFDDKNFRVLRGASWATEPSVARNTFRNWDYRERRQIFSGIRLAWDVR